MLWIENGVVSRQLSAASYGLRVAGKNKNIAAFETRLEVRSHKIEPIAFVGDCLQAIGIKERISAKADRR